MKTVIIDKLVEKSVIQFYDFIIEQTSKLFALAHFNFVLITPIFKFKYYFLLLFMFIYFVVYFLFLC